MVIHWKLINNSFIYDTFIGGSIKSKVKEIPIGIFDSDGKFTATESFQLQNHRVHTWNIEIYLKMVFNMKDIYFNDDVDFLVVESIDAHGCGFLFHDNFDEYLEELVLLNDPRKSNFSTIDGTYVYDNRIVIITNPNFNDIFKLSFYSKKLTISPFRLNREASPYQLLKNYIFLSVPNVPTRTREIVNISGGLIKCNAPGFYKYMYEYDITSFYPNIILKYLDNLEPIKILMQPLIDDQLKCLKMYIYGMLGSQYSVLYNPRIMDTITTIGRTIIDKYKTRCVIVATDAIFFTYPIKPNFDELPFKTTIHQDMFVISASQYFTRSKYKGFPKTILSDHIHILLNQLLIKPEFENVSVALLEFMKSLVEFPLLPIPLKSGEQITAIIKNNLDVRNVDKFLYVMKYRKIIYNVCQHKAKKKMDYESFKIMYNYFMYQ